MHTEIATGFHQMHSQAWSFAMVVQRERQLPELPTMAMEGKEEALLGAAFQELWQSPPAGTIHRDLGASREM